MFRLGHGELVVTVDSDTAVDPEGIRRIAEAFQDDRVGAATGLCLALNPARNLLTRLIAVRYRLLFEQERAAQSWFGAVLCCHGAFSAYRRTVLVECWDAYQRQTYAGVSCTTGDDLRLTNLVVAAGHRSVYAPLAKARTQVPEALSEYALQQLRWSRSFYRELMCTLSALRDRHLYLFVEVASRATFPLVVLFGLALGIATLLVGRSSGPVQGIGLLAILLAISAAVVLWQSRTFHYLLHGLLYLVVLPVHIYAIVTRGEARWETRTVPHRAPDGSRHGR